MRTIAQLCFALVFGVLMVGAQDANPIKVSTYYESLCPYSKEFIVDQLTPTYALVPEIMVVELVPYGNAQTYPSGDTYNFTCQHGEEECVGNKIHSCALSYYPENAQSVPFVGCDMAADDPVVGAEQCATDNGLDWDKINTCAQSDEGSELLYENGVKTESVNIGGTPWILIDDVYDPVLYNYARSNLLALVCTLYQGTKPANCP